MPGAVNDFVVQLDGGVHAAAAARRAVRANARELREPLDGDVLLLVTELVTNAVRHGGVGAEDPVRLECRSADGRARFLVTDAGAWHVNDGTAPRRHAPALNGDGGSGWGLRLVAEVADEWGVLAAAPGTCVWFDVTL
jgi:anti-sigma regulatory factor (Ser/Thr protein kinase)